jgi:hypothetical protein
MFRGDARNGFEISKGDASIKHFEISKGDALNACSKKFECEYDKWSPNESMR